MHVPVLADEALHWLGIREDGTYVDCTVGAGGHAARIAERLQSGRLVALDRDPVAVELAGARLAEFPNVTVLHHNYAELDIVLGRLGIEKVDGILIDAGVSSLQLDDETRGFSFQQEGPLDMRMDSTQVLTAEKLLAHIDTAELVRVLQEYGDVRGPRRIAECIIRRRQQAPLRNTHDLAGAVADAVKTPGAIADETRRVFQAVRIAVNDELNALEKGIRQAVDRLTPGGRLVGITFHSGEDRIVKNLLREASKAHKDVYPDGRVRRTVPPSMRLLTKGPVGPTENEVIANPRAHSARLRAAERLPEGN